MKFKMITVLIWSILVIGPPIIAWRQLSIVAEKNIFETIIEFDNKFQTRDSIEFTFLVAIIFNNINTNIGSSFSMEFRQI